MLRKTCLDFIARDGMTQELLNYYGADHTNQLSTYAINEFYKVYQRILKYNGAIVQVSIKNQGQHIRLSLIFEFLLGFKLGLYDQSRNCFYQLNNTENTECNYKSYCN